MALRAFSMLFGLSAQDAHSLLGYALASSDLWYTPRLCHGLSTQDSDMLNGLREELRQHDDLAAHMESEARQRLRSTDLFRHGRSRVRRRWKHTTLKNEDSFRSQSHHLHWHDVVGSRIPGREDCYWLPLGHARHG
ncbi:hypothetical protein LTR49_005406 [Elasticomyces elasticus]|nr:hypothetical protein LTR49_005406 [Elasticomyces elasticus]